MIKSILGHTKTILKHKYWVFYYCCKAGISWQGFWHDMSKFSPVEFWESVKYYQDGKSSPIPAAKCAQGYSLAWQHHKGCNPHHYEYWTDNYDSGTTCVEMPYKYAVEMLCDYLGAARAYLGKDFSYEVEYEWWLHKRKGIKMHEGTRNFLDFVFSLLRNGEDTILTKEFLTRYWTLSNINN